MEKKLIEDWLKVEINSGYGSGSGDGYGYGYGFGSGDGYGSGYGDGYGYGSGYDDGYGYGYGDGSGDGYGYGYGYGSGYDDGYGYGYGFGSGDGYGSGSGDGSGYGDGSGDGYGLKKYDDYYIFKIDNVNTIITNIKKNIAKGFIVNKDLTLQPTFIIKGSNLFSHGRTVKEAIQSLEEKIFSKLNIEAKIEEFKKQFNKTDKYSGHLYFKWHNLLTGSCLQGRNNFVENSGYSLDDKFTVKEFLNIVKNDYGWNVLKELEKYYK